MTGGGVIDTISGFSGTITKSYANGMLSGITVARSQPPAQQQSNGGLQPANVGQASQL